MGSPVYLALSGGATAAVVGDSGESGLGGGGGLVRLRLLPRTDGTSQAEAEAVGDDGSLLLKALTLGTGEHDDALVRSFSREVGFYQLASAVGPPLAVPVCHAALRQPPALLPTRGDARGSGSGAAPGGGFTLVLQDLHDVGFRTASMADGLSMPEVGAVLHELATLHAAFWRVDGANDEGVALGSCPPTEALSTADLAAKINAQCTPPALQAFVSHYCTGCTAEDERADFAGVLEIAEQHVGTALRGHDAGACRSRLGRGNASSWRCPPREYHDLQQGRRRWGWGWHFGAACGLRGCRLGVTCIRSAAVSGLLP